MFCRVALYGPAPVLFGINKVSTLFVWCEYVTFVSVHRTWTSLVSVKSWRNMTRSWTPLAGPTGAWLTWRWHLSTPARRSRSSSPRQRCRLAYTQTHTYTLWYKDVGGNKTHTENHCLLFVCVCVCVCVYVCVDSRHHRAGGRRSAEGHEEVESSSTRGSSGQKLVTAGNRSQAN